MNLKPTRNLTEKDLQSGMKLVIGDGLASEAMTTLTGGTFLVAMAVLLGASNFQIGMLAALPTFTNIFQLISIWLVRRFNNRRAVSVLCSIFARIPLILAGMMILFLPEAGIETVIFILFFFYFFGSIAGPSWNAWMKDLIPENILGTYFSKRSSYMQTLNVILALALAFTIDYVKKHYPQFELSTYAYMFILAGIIGIIGALVLSKVREPMSYLTRENIFQLMKKPLTNKNFLRLLMFNSAWVFALNIATPFFTVFMMKTMGLSISYIIGFTIISQLCSILTIRLWGRFADRYSNKTIIAISAPLYILCLVGWCFAGIYSHPYMNLVLLFLIHVMTGISTAGINLSLTNISLKLSPGTEAIVYLSAKNIVTAVFSSLAPLVGGYLADYFDNRSLSVMAQWSGPKVSKAVTLVLLHEYNFLFLIGAVLALLAIELLVAVKETGEVEKDEVVRIMRMNVKNNLKDYYIIGDLISWHEQIRSLLKRRSSSTN
ncbi:MFS transporter [Flavihumibacter solisilvae]|uniref:MFS transporter n=1 Tax=Flavihumibacter solisilvae TaxID=1349421 RepID=A0A0C1IHW1_9BACT|nr:MFS transporter [Flavihumibacter solisilvae]KIC93800.1 MFS transporter [Flavihumibacter solisilvae]